MICWTNSRVLSSMLSIILLQPCCINDSCMRNTRNIISPTAASEANYPTVADAIDRSKYKEHKIYYICIIRYTIFTMQKRLYIEVVLRKGGYCLLIWIQMQKMQILSIFMDLLAAHTCAFQYAMIAVHNQRIIKCIVRCFLS